MARRMWQYVVRNAVYTIAATRDMETEGWNGVVEEEEKEGGECVRKHR